MDKINLTNLFRSLSIVSLTATFYGLMQNKSINEILEELEKEKYNNHLINEKYKNLLENKLNESELKKIISNEKMKGLMDEMNLLKEKISNQNLLNESDIKNIDNTNNILNQLTDINQTFKNSNNKLNNIMDSIETYIKSKNNNNFSDSFMNLIHDLNNIIQSMSMHQKLAYIHISGSFFILLSLLSIISIFYGDYLIIKLNLENKFPRLAKFIQLRRKFQHFYILLDVIISIIILLIIIYINIVLYF
jgi:hypothetical protein